MTTVEAPKPAALPGLVSFTLPLLYVILSSSGLSGLLVAIGYTVEAGRQHFLGIPLTVGLSRFRDVELDLKRDAQEPKPGAVPGNPAPSRAPLGADAAITATSTTVQPMTGSLNAHGKEPAELTFPSETSAAASNRRFGLLLAENDHYVTLYETKRTTQSIYEIPGDRILQIRVIGMRDVIALYAKVAIRP
jgi:hypothetical protein